MIAMTTTAAATPDAKAPSMAAFISSLSGSYHSADDRTPATKAAPTTIRMGGN